MTDTELQEQFKRCQGWKDPAQWELLGVEYARQGYELNAAKCFDLAGKCGAELPVSTETAGI